MKLTRRLDLIDYEGEFTGEAPDVMVVEIDEELAARIKMLAGEAKRLKVFAIQVVNHDARWHRAAHDPEKDAPWPWDDENECPVPGEEFNGLDHNFLHVADDDFWWSATLKGTGVMIKCEIIMIWELLEEERDE
jgi:hypothetical protein